jgi:hypothetical protein
VTVCVVGIDGCDGVDDVDWVVCVDVDDGGVMRSGGSI